MKAAARTLFFLITLCLTVASFAQGKIVAVVSAIKGKAFYTSAGKTYMIRAGMHLPVQAEIFTDLGAQLSINDYYDHVYHLAGGGHITLHTNLVELKEGYLWVKSLNYDSLKGPLRVTTANAIVEHQKGEGIVSFDVHTGKTQVLAVQGGFDFRNIRQEHYRLSLEEGQFSFITDDHENGNPRRPTPIGYSSFQKVTGLFEGVEPLKEESKKIAKAPQYEVPDRTVNQNVKTDASFEAALKNRKRGIASTAKTHHETQEGKVILLKLHEPQSIEEKEKKLLNYYSHKMAELKPAPKKVKKWKPTYQKKSSVAVHVFGQGNTSSRVPASIKAKQPKVAPKKAQRTPASIGGMTPKIEKSPFESELLRQYKNQMRHDKEVNELIDQLKSIDMDYKKEY